MSGGGSADAARIGSIEPRGSRFEAESDIGALPRPCPVCREHSSKPHHGQGSPLRRCTCGVVYMDPIPTHETIAAREDEAFHGGLREETAEMFSAYYRDYPEDAVVRSFRENIQRLRMLTGGGTLLDVGVGTGLLLHLAREAGFSPLGIEISPDAAARASQEFGVDVRVGAFETFRPDAPVDAITMGDVLEHAGDPRRFLEHAASLLRPGGALWVAVPNCRSTMFWVADALARIPRLDRLAGRIYVPNHYTYFTPATLARLVDEAGFAVGELRQDSPYLGRYRLSLPVKAALAALIAVGRATGLEARVEVIAVRR